MANHPFTSPRPFPVGGPFAVRPEANCCVEAPDAVPRLHWLAGRQTGALLRIQPPVGNPGDDFDVA